MLPNREHLSIKSEIYYFLHPDPIVVVVVVVVTTSVVVVVVTVTSGIHGTQGTHGTHGVHGVQGTHVSTHSSFTSTAFAVNPNCMLQSSKKCPAYKSSVFPHLKVTQPTFTLPVFTFKKM